MTDLWGIIIPIVVSVILSATTALVISRYAGPAQAAYVDALEGRLKVVTGERDDALRELPILRKRVADLESEVHDLKAASSEKDREIADLYRRIDLDDRRLTLDEKRLGVDERRLAAEEHRGWPRDYQRGERGERGDRGPRGADGDANA